MTTAAQESLSETVGKTYAVADKESNAWVHGSKTVIARLAAPLLPQMGLTPDRTEPVQWLDNAAGPGVVAQELHALLPRETLEKGSILATDLAEGMVNMLKGRIENEGWVNTEARVLNAQDTKLPESSFSHVSICLGLHIIPDPDSAVKDAMRVLKPGGIFGATTFPKESKSHTFWLPDMRAAFKAMPFEAPFPDEMPMQLHNSGVWTDPAWIKTHLTELGLKDVTSEIKRGSYQFKDAEEYVHVCAPMLPFLMSKAWSETQREEHSLEEVKELVLEFLKKKYDGKGWGIEWDVIYSSGRVEK